MPPLKHKWPAAREAFKNAEFAITALPIELQRIVVSEAMRASIEVKDYSGAAKRSSDLDVVGVSSELKPAISVLRLMVPVPARVVMVRLLGGCRSVQLQLASSFGGSGGLPPF